MLEILHNLAMASTALVMIMVVYQIILAIGAVINRQRALKEALEPMPEMDQYPPLTILVPAHNEEMVIERTVRTLLALRYPEERLTLMVINDASTDNTANILDRLAIENPRVKVYHRQKPEGGCGKAAALNAALNMVSDEFIAIYDADNCPEPDSLLHLISRFIRKPEMAAVVGKFRCGNKRQNFLTRCVNIEGLCFQNVVQAGRHAIMDVAFLTGTNYAIRRSVLLALGGWDEKALAEDSELSTRLYMEGYRVDFVPYSQSWEQEPETMLVWMKQRTRWARGNNYAVVKLLKNFSKSKDKLRTLENLYMLFMSYTFLMAIVIAQTCMALTYLDITVVGVNSELIFYFWKCATLIYFIQLWYILSFDREQEAENLLVGLLMYFFYGYLWMFAILRSLHQDIVQRKANDWDKTARFQTELEVGGGN